MSRHLFSVSKGKHVNAVYVLFIWIFQFNILLSQEPRGLKIGVLLSGEDVENTNIIVGATAAVAELSKNSKTQFELVFKSHRNQWGQEADDAVDALFEENASALIAPASGIVSHLMFQVAGRTRIPSVTLCSDTSVTGATIPWCIRIAPTTLEEVAAVGNYIKTAKGGSIETVVFAPYGRTGREIAGDIQKAATNTIFKISGILNIESAKFPDTKEFKNLLSKKPDCVFIWLPHADAVRVIGGLHSIGFRGFIVVTSKLFTADFLASSQEWGYEIYFSTAPLNNAFGNTGEIHQDELKDGRRSYISILTHDAVILLAEHLQRCDLTHPHKNFPPNDVKGWTGELVFNKNGDRITKTQVWKIVDGKAIKISN